MSALAASRARRTFGPVVAVDDVSLTVDRGEVVGLVGANGAGKTTLIRLLLGLLACDAGTVTLAGGPPSRDRRARTGYVPQGLGLWPDLTVAEHLRLTATVYGPGTDAQPPPELAAHADRLVGDLPLGLRRRMAFALALAHHPDVLILDEPTSGVDPLGRAELWDAIGTAAGRGAAVLVSTHYLDEAGRCDRVVLLAEGRVVAAGPAEELTADRHAVAVTADRWEVAWARLEQAGLPVLPAGRRLRIPDRDPAAVRGALGDLHATVTSVPATLEEVFLTEAAPVTASGDRT